MVIIKLLICMQGSLNILDNKNRSKGRFFFRYICTNKLTMKDFKARQLDFYMASVIFVVSILELISWHLQKGEEAIILNAGNNYLVYYYPLLNTLIIWFFALFFFFKVLRYNSCIYTIVVSVIYFFIQTVNVLAFFLGFGMKIYETIAYPALLFGLVVLTLIKIVRWCLR